MQHLTRCPSSQAAMFTAMLSGLSSHSVDTAAAGGVAGMGAGTARSLLDCAAQAGHNQARSLGLASLASSTQGETPGLGEFSPAFPLIKKSLDESILHIM